MPGPSTLKLSVVEGPDAPLSITFQGETMSIGRAKSSDLVLADSQVSRRHAEIVREGPDFVLVDLDSPNGMFLGEERAKIARHTLRDGDSIRIGHDLLQVTVAVPHDEDATELRRDADPESTATVLRPRRNGLVLKVVSGPDQGKVFTPDKNRVEIGRRPDCDVRLSDPGVSRLHATIRRDGGRYAIYDENSANGLETGNAQRVFFAELHDGMVFRLSETEIEVSLAGAQSASAARSR
jgi:pSer/pThr/pTyr-binding forkhead associated (FHA) protein